MGNQCCASKPSKLDNQVQESSPPTDTTEIIGDAVEEVALGQVDAATEEMGNSDSTPRPRHSPGGLYGAARSEGGRIPATGGKFWAKIRILWGIASGASGLSPPQAENFFENDAFKEKIY